MAKKTTLGIHEELAAMIRAQPFRPFDIKTADGDTIHVWHPDFIMRSPRGDTAIAYDKEGHHRIINLRMVVTLEPTRPKGGLGKPGKR
jgi:hypothetical protein